MSFTTELVNKQFQTNMIIKIGSVYYSQFAVDSGLSVDSDKIGVVKNVKISPTRVDVRKVRSTVASVNFDLTDINEVISIAIGNDVSQFLNRDVLIYVGFITGSFDFADYKLVASVSIKTISKKPNTYSFSAVETTNLLQANFFQTNLVTAYNQGIVSYQAIQFFICENSSVYPEYNGERKGFTGIV